MLTMINDLNSVKNMDGNFYQGVCIFDHKAIVLCERLIFTSPE